MRVFVVLNPVAGRTQAGEVRGLLERYFDNPDWHLEVYETTGEEQIGELVRAAVGGGVDMVFAAGGDGTVSAVADGLVYSDIPLGIIPSGTSNVLSQDLELPLNAEKACRMLSGEDTTTRTIDAIQVGEQYFLIGVGAGADAEVMSNTSRGRKRVFGPMAYVWTAMKTVFGVQPRRYTIITDGKAIQLKASVVLLSNVGTLTGPLRWGPHIKPDDGRIDISVIRGRDVFDYMMAAYDVLPGSSRRAWHIRYLSAKESVTITVDRPTMIQGDGELLGKRRWRRRWRRRRLE